MYDSFMSVENDNDLYVTGMMLFFANTYICIVQYSPFSRLN